MGKSTITLTQFKDPRLAQLFGRYATYVGGSPKDSPAILSLIAHAEASGVWRVDGGLHALPRAIEALAKARGALFHYGTEVETIAQSGGGFTVTAKDQAFTADQIVFNGDPRALNTGTPLSVMRCTGMLLTPAPARPMACTVLGISMSCIR